MAGDDIQITVSADTNVVAVNDFLTFQVRVSGGDSGSASKPVVSGLENFSIVSESSGTEVSIVNLSMRKSSTYTYQLTPKRPGIKAVLQATTRIGRKEFRSNSIEIETLDASAGTGRGMPPNPFGRQRSLMDDFFGNRHSPFGGLGRKRYEKDDYLLQASTNKKSVYVGEEVVYSLRFYRKDTVWSDAQYEHPEMKGFWSEMLPENNRVINGQESVGGMPYEVSEMPLIIYPLTDGKKTIGKGKIRFKPDAFSSAMVLPSNEVVLEVKPLPGEGKPDDFSGLVGSFDIKATVEGTSGPVIAAEVGKPITLIVEVSGKGSLHAIQKPSEPAMEGFERFDPEISDDFTRGPEGSSGTRRYRFILVPETAGAREIGPFSINFFDPVSGSYKTAKTTPLLVSVSGTGGHGAGSADSKESARKDKPVETILELKPNLSTMEDEGRPYYRRWSYLACLPVLVAAFWVVNYRVVSGRQFLKREPSPYEIGKRRLERAGAEIGPGDKDIFYNEILKGFASYISARRGMPEDDMDRVLAEAEPLVGMEAAARLRELANACREGKYSPVRPEKKEMERILAEAENLLRAMEGRK